jgi:hypothetical protein
MQSSDCAADSEARRILIVAANPIETDRLKIDEEVRLIKERLQKADTAPVLKDGELSLGHGPLARRHDPLAEARLAEKPALLMALLNFEWVTGNPLRR